ncbi:alpha/beta fold hydrolase [Undibacterium sp. TJN19]|uniref:alpha/beta fold hydrolase n=1 Tax=Undibacterium sp. TJN19 TaxID=3413055 RepID=UPI003BF33B75
METLQNNSFASKMNSSLAMNTLLQMDGQAKISDAGTGQPILLLHGGGGSATVFGMSQALSAKARVLLPTHPGFDGTPRPAHLNSVAELAKFYLQLLEVLGLRNVIVIGASLGGWTAAEMALADSGHNMRNEDCQRIKGLILINAVGIEVPAAPVADVSGLTRPEMIRLASHNPDLVLANTPAPTPERLAVLAANAATLAVYDGGAGMMLPGLREKLVHVATPTLVLWGESDGIASVVYGKAYAAAFANSKFELITEAGHLPQIEQPAQTLTHIDNFILELDSTV